MTPDERKAIKFLVDQETRRKVDNGYLDCDPESLTLRADDADKMGFAEIADALRNFRDKVVNPLIGEGWDINRIEKAMAHHFGIEI